jgi:hypothetical protein
MECTWKGSVLAVVAVFIAASAVWAEPAKPASPVRLVFIHHSTGGNWLADPNDNGPYGGLGMALMNNNYHVSATNYGWGPDGIGDRTDIPDWPEWFTGENSTAILSALFTESGQNVDGFGDWSRLASVPAGENLIILFKSCFPNSNLDGNPNDPPAANLSHDFTVANAKAVYNHLLTYFQTRPDKLFIAITAPPLMASETDATRAANARAFASWLVSDWLDGYPLANVAVFDYYNVLTAPDNHHRCNNNAIEHVIGAASNTAYYPSDDSHPNTTGQQKATSEFVPLLNYWYQRWQSGGGTDPITPAATTLYFPHVATSLPWQTEIAIINTSDQTGTGTLRALSDEGQLVETKDVTLSARGRRQIIISDEFTDHTEIAYIIFDTDSAAVQGYTKFYREGYYRAAIPAVKEVNTSDIYISHIASTADWWTGVSLVNTTSATKELTITFNTGQSVPYILNANEHRAFDIASLFNNQPQPDIQSAVITNASGVIGLELFGSRGWGTQLEGILLTGNTASTLYYPHVAGDEWWTGIVAYNPSWQESYITITPYSAQGILLSPSTLTIAEEEKYIGAVAGLGLPDQTAWFKIDSTIPLTGFELFGTVDGNQLAAYAGSGGMGAKAGVFPKIEKNGWTGIAFVNTEDSAASVTLTAYNDNGTAVATEVLPVGGHAKVVDNPEAIFTQDISGATYIAYSSDKNVVGFQLNGSLDWTMLDGLPGL